MIIKLITVNSEKETKSHFAQRTNSMCHIHSWAHLWQGCCWGTDSQGWFGCSHSLNPLCRPWHRNIALEDVAPWSLLWTEGLGFLLPCSVLLVRTALSGSCTMENASIDLGAEPWNCCGRMRGGYKNIAIHAMKGGQFVKILAKIISRPLQFYNQYNNSQDFQR